MMCPLRDYKKDYKAIAKRVAGIITVNLLLVGTIIIACIIA